MKDILNEEAKKHNTLPSFLFKHKNRYIDILPKLKNELTSLKQLVKYLNITRNESKQLKLFETWYIHRSNKEKNDEFFNINLSVLNDYPWFSNELIDELEENIEVLKKELNDEIINLQRRDEIDLQKIIPSSPFSIQEVQYKIILATENIDDIYELFDKIKVNHNIPYVILGEFYKIYRDYIPSLPLMTGKEDKILLSFQETFIEIKKTHQKHFEVSMNLKSGEEGVQDLDKVFQLIEKTFVTKLIKESAKVENMNGEFLIPKSHFSTFLWSDMVLNHSKFSQLYIDESRGAHSELADSVRNHFIDSNIIFEIFSRKVEGGDKYVKYLDDKSKFPIGSQYIRIKIFNIPNEIEGNQVTVRIKKYIHLYIQEKENYLSLYKNFFGKRFFAAKFPPIQEPSKKEIVETSLQPLFITNYKTACSIRPRVIPEEEVPNWEENRVMLFPKTPDEGIPQRYYVCDFIKKTNRGDEKYFYPGVKLNNKLENKKEFPYIPCCYIEDQYKKKGSKLNQYLGKTTKTTTVQQLDLKTDKMVSDNGYGYLPSLIQELFDENYRRFGVRESPNSFFDCVERATNTNLNYKSLIKQKKEIGQQEAVDLDIDYILNNNEFMDPLFFINYAQELYNVNIYLFTRNETYPKGMLVIPNYHHAHLTYSVRRPNSIFIYFHKGTSLRDYPQCEIIRLREGDMMFSNKNDISITIAKYYNTIYQFYQNGSYLSPIRFNIIRGKLISQFIDNLGKTRMIKIEYQNKQFTLFTNPLPPLNIPNQKYEIIKLTQTEAMSFISENNASIISQSKNEIHIKIGNTMMFIPVIDLEEIESVPNVTFRIFERSDSHFNKFKREKRFAKYYTENCLYHFSKYLNEFENLEERNEINLANDFLNERTVNGTLNVNEEIYNNFDNKNLLLGNKLIVPNNLKSRIQYILAWSLRRKYDDIRNYQNSYHLYNFYEYPSDFAQFDNSIIIKGIDYTTNWVKNRTSFALSIYKEIKPFNKQYLLLREENMSENIKENMYLIQKAKSLQNAMFISRFWRDNGYIPTFMDQEENVEDFELWTSGNEVYGNNDVRILGVKSGNNILYYSVLYIK